MKKTIILLMLFYCVASLYAQDSGTNGLVIGSQVDNTYSALVINGANQPANDISKRDIIFNFKSAGQSIIRSFRGVDWSTYLQFWTTPYGSSIPQMRMHINQDGNVGIGTTNPLADLDVSGKIRTQDLNLIGKIGRDLAYPFNYNNVEMDHFSLSWIQDSDTSEEDGYSMWASGFGGMKLFTNSLPRLVIKKDGNVGIGTTAPRHKLDVNGTIRAKEILVSVDAGADHVFHPEYKLTSLSDLKSFVEENKHLPDIPSEKQMQTEGLNLNEFQIKLLQKIEELTLYTIQLQEKVNKLEQQMKTINH